MMRWAAGYTVLEEGGTAINAVKAAVVMLEDNVMFNAGRGAVFTKERCVEMDAAIMSGERSCSCRLLCAMYATR